MTRAEIKRKIKNEKDPMKRKALQRMLDTMKDTHTFVR